MRKLQLTRPIVWLDLETTGLDLRKDRIVEISALREEVGGSIESRTRRVNPGMPIPPEATAIHKIRDEDVRGEPPFERLAKSFADFLEDADLGGFGLERFDAPLLVMEFERAGVEFSLEGRALVDAQRVFHVMEPRDLGAACRYYLGRDLEEAHSAAADAEAAREVLLGQLERYPDLPLTPSDLAARFGDKSRVDPEGKIVWRGSEATINFGKHRGRSLRELASQEPDYLRWMAGRDFSGTIVTLVQGALEGRFPEPPAKR